MENNIKGREIKSHGALQRKRQAPGISSEMRCLEAKDQRRDRLQVKAWKKKVRVDVAGEDIPAVLQNLNTDDCLLTAAQLHSSKAEKRD